MLMLAGEIHYLVYLRLGDFVGENTANANTALMHMQHHFCCVLDRHFEKPLQHMDDKFHGRIIVIEHQHFIKRRLGGFRFRLGEDTRVLPAIAILIIIWRAWSKARRVRVFNSR
jgi:hypothetical protein